MRANFGILEARAPRRAADKCSLHSHFWQLGTLCDRPALEVPATGFHLIPKFNHSGVLPPFLPGADPAQPGTVSPYSTNLGLLEAGFATSGPRVAILIGFLKFRVSLKAAGFSAGFQWLDGSFLEDVETSRNRPPNDLDLVTFAARPKAIADAPSWTRFVYSRQDLFMPNMTKKAFSCDAYFVDLNLPPDIIVSQTAYWFGLFSHQRVTSLWKGMLSIPLVEDETPLLKKFGLQNYV